MTQPTLEGLPQELIADILEYVCEEIVKDLTELQLSSKTPCHKLLHRFVHLHLVSRTFHAVLTHYARVDGVPVRKRLLDLQLGKFKLHFGGERLLRLKVVTAITCLSISIRDR